MKAAKEFTQAKPSGSSLTSACTMSSGPAASSFSGYFSCLQLATSPKGHLFSVQVLFPTSPKATCCCLGKEKLADSRPCPCPWLHLHQAPVPPARILQPCRGAGGGCTALSKPQPVHTFAGVSPVAQALGVFNIDFIHPESTTHVQTRCVSSDPRSWLGGLSGLYLLPYLPLFDMLTCCISSLSPRREEQVGCSLYADI